MRRARNRLALLAATVVALSVGVGVASAGWLGLSDTKYFRYDDPGHVCTDGIEFGVAHPFGPQAGLTVEVTRGSFDPSRVFVPVETILPVTTIGPLDTFDPNLDIGGTPGHWFEFFRLTWTSTPPVGSDIQIVLRTGISQAFTFDAIEDCTLLSFTGFFQPIDNGEFNRMKAGRAVPVQFSLGGDRGLSIFAAGYPRVTTVSCEGNATADPVEETETAGASALTYDAASDQYHYVWKTDKSWAGSCRRLELKFTDGSVQTALFDLTK